LFIPARAPYDFYTRDFEKGLALYSSGVLIMEKCADLLPEHFRFMRGLVDSQDLSLNISREMLQHDRQLKVISGHLERKIKSELLDMLKNDREKYETFYKQFGTQLKYGAYANFGANGALLSELLMFTSSFENKPVTFAEYISRMKEGQEEIYYAAGRSEAQIAALPQTELVLERGYEVLYLLEDVDEFVLRVLGKAGDKPFKSLSAADFKLEGEQPDVKEKAESAAGMLGVLKSALEGKVDDVVVSARLKTHPACLTAQGGVSLEMEKVLNAMPADQKVKAQRVLELNPDHPVFGALERAYKDHPDKLRDYAKLLYSQALLIEGLPVEDPAEFSKLLSALMV